ncbi:MAG TPA: helix-turn-helix transcriptional regulator [Rhodocyclaceae bacterium]|nr:helix-turn-helix transcriptional regulator [Rhodocyclaceae bacterium]
MKANVTITGPVCFAMRKDRGLNQTQFWSPLGVTQSGASRYESGRRIPKPLIKLIQLMYVTGLNEVQTAAIAKV